MIKLIYIILIVIITIWTLYLYLINDHYHKNELRRIEIIENKMRQKREFINSHRMNSIPCNIPNLNTPRDCYNNSNYNCKWKLEADRCNQNEA